MTEESNLEKILGLLRSGDPRELEQAVHLIQSLGDPSILAHALSGTEYDVDAWRRLPVAGSLPRSTR